MHNTEGNTSTFPSSIREMPYFENDFWPSVLENGVKEFENK
jgi:hypothetical protein